MRTPIGGPMTICATAGPSTIVFHLLHHAEVQPERTALVFLHNGEGEERRLDYGQLLAEAGAVASELHRRGLAGQRAMLFFHPGADFAIAFLACLMAGVVAVPMHPPASRRLLDRARLVIDDCQAAAVLTSSANLSAVDALAGAGGLLVLATDVHATGPRPTPEQIEGWGVEATATAFLQYTSGSTGDPKGVMISQANLIADSLLIRDAFGDTRNTVMVSWLPLLHDMGLIGSLIHPLHLGATAVHMTPQAMIRRPLRWLEAIHRYRGTLTGAPDFAWRLLCEQVTPEQVAGLDLSCLRTVYSGSEPVRARTLERVLALLVPAGLREEAVRPVYGLAEATLLVTGGPPLSPLRVERPVAGGDEGVAYVGCGCPQPAGSVAIVDPDLGTVQPVGVVGEVWVAGAHVGGGYWGRPELSERTFRATLPGDARPWLRTGDLGFLAQGELFISGRRKDLLIVNGRKHHPEDIETTVQNAVAECGQGGCAVFQAEVQGAARNLIAVEMAQRPDTPEELAGLRSRINAAVWSGHEISLDEVVPVRLGRIPRTTSGKVRRAETCALWRSGRLGRLAGEE
ncbi:MAG: fatty acyl-AMP ligase [Planctomycetes bacterium]|nr:fatty acyl-AMP ligase [Planctomycetota bacterium]